MNEHADVAVPDDDAGEFVVRMAEAIGAQAGASAAFGQPVTHDGTTVIPVARSVWGFGGGSGTAPAATKGPDGAGSGGGGGGGVVVQPLGYIVMRDGGVTYRRLTPVPLLLLLAGAAGAAVAVLIRR